MSATWAPASERHSDGPFGRRAVGVMSFSKFLIRDVRVCDLPAGRHKAPSGSAERLSERTLSLEVKSPGRGLQRLPRMTKGHQDVSEV